LYMSQVFQRTICRDLDSTSREKKKARLPSSKRTYTEKKRYKHAHF
jgi:hypothetical protein